MNSGPIILNASNIYVQINNNWVPITSTTGTWSFSGPGVVGNLFYPNTLGPHIITLTYTDPNGCTGTVSITINVARSADEAERQAKGEKFDVREETKLDDLGLEVGAALAEGGNDE